MQKSIRRDEFSASDIDLGSEEKFILGIIGDFASRLKQKYDYSSQEIVNLFQKEEFLIPVEIFSCGLAPAEALTKFLKENYDKNFHEISLLIKRNEKSVWQNYRRAVKKMPSNFAVEDSMKIPVSAFSDKRLSVFECLIRYLKEQKQMKNIKIAKMLGKHTANVWSVYNRAVKKVKRGQK